MFFELYKNWLRMITLRENITLFWSCGPDCFGCFTDVDEYIKLKMGQLKREFILCSRLRKYLDDSAAIRYLDYYEHKYMYFWHVNVYHLNEYMANLFVVCVFYLCSLMQEIRLFIYIYCSAE